MWDLESFAQVLYDPTMKPILSTEYDGKPRWLWPKKCKTCRTTFYAPKNRLADRQTCSTACSGKQHRRRVRVKCAMCHKRFERTVNKLKNSKSGVTFCTRACKDIGQRIEGIGAIHPAHYGNGKFAYRNKAFKSLPAKCARCGYAKDKKMLDVHHRDRDRAHNHVTNLEVVCVWCHAVETRRVRAHPWNGKLGS